MNAHSRCRLIIVVPAQLRNAPELLGEALAGGDVASVILSKPASNDAGFQQYSNALVPIIQAAGAAAIIADDTQLVGRCNADGLHIDLPGGNAGLPQLADTIAKFAPEKIVGAGSVNTRHMALSLGEAGPDYVFFGKLSGDIKPQAHPKMLALAAWWAQMVEVPGICLAGSDLDSIVEVAKTGVDFAALSSAIFDYQEGAKEAVAQANLLLDQHAPVFENV